LFPDPTLHTTFFGHRVAIGGGFGFPGLFGMEIRAETAGNPGRVIIRDGGQQAFVSRVFLMLGLMILVGLLLY
jgi:hypothetical protein